MVMTVMTFPFATPCKKFMFKTGGMELHDPLPLSGRELLLQNRVPAPLILAPAWSSAQGVPVLCHSLTGTTVGSAS